MAKSATPKDGRMMTLFLIVVIDLIGFGIIIPLLPFYGRFFEAEPDTVTILMATFSLCQFIAAPFWGRISDKYGRRPVLLIGLIGTALSYVWLGFADALWMLFAARALSGVMAGNIAAAFAYMSDVTTRENRSKGMGLLGAAFGIGFILGPAIGGVLAGPDPDNPQVLIPSLTAAGLSVLALIATFIFIKESLPASARRKAQGGGLLDHFRPILFLMRRETAALVLLVTLLATAVFAGMEVTFAMWMDDSFGWGPRDAGLIFAFGGLVSAIFQGGITGRLAQKYGEEKLVIAGSIVLGLGLLLIPFSDSVLQLLGAIGITAIGFSLVSPPLNSLISFQVEAQDQGSAMGTARAVTTLARVVGPLAAGELYAGLSLNWPYYAGAMTMILVLALALRVNSKRQAARHGAASP